MKASVAGLTYGCDIFIATCGRLSQFVEEKYVCLIRNIEERKIILNLDILGRIEIFGIRWGRQTS